MPDPHVVVLAPLGGDAKAVAELVRRIGREPRICEDASSFSEALKAEPLCAIVTEEALRPDIAEIIADHANSAPLWSSVPLVFAVTDPENPPRRCRQAIEAASPVASVMLKRPLRFTTFASVCEIQISLRERQFENAALMKQISEQKEYQQFLLHELQHRTRNLLGLMQATIRLSAHDSTDAEDLRERLYQRLRSISTAHTRLIREQAKPDDIEIVIDEQLQAFLSSRRQITLEGPRIPLDAQIAFDLALVVHELATNAAKYGSLSTGEGRVSVGWKQCDRMLVLQWTETGGPPVTPPKSTSFGTDMINGLLAQHGGGAEFAYDEKGLEATLSMMLERHT